MYFAHSARLNSLRIDPMLVPDGGDGSLVGFPHQRSVSRSAVSQRGVMSLTSYNANRHPRIGRGQ
jgi:hypothetical protein